MSTVKIDEKTRKHEEATIEGWVEFDAEWGYRLRSPGSKDGVGMRSLSAPVSARFEGRKVRIIILTIDDHLPLEENKS